MSRHTCLTVYIFRNDTNRKEKRKRERERKKQRNAIAQKATNKVESLACVRDTMNIRSCVRVKMERQSSLSDMKKIE